MRHLADITIQMSFSSSSKYNLHISLILFTAILLYLLLILFTRALLYLPNPSQFLPKFGIYVLQILCRLKWLQSVSP